MRLNTKIALTIILVFGTTLIFVAIDKKLVRVKMIDKETYDKLDAEPNEYTIDPCEPDYLNLTVGSVSNVFMISIEVNDYNSFVTMFKPNYTYDSYIFMHIKVGDKEVNLSEEEFLQLLGFEPEVDWSYEIDKPNDLVLTESGSIFFDMNGLAVYEPANYVTFGNWPDNRRVAMGFDSNDTFFIEWTDCNVSEAAMVFIKYMRDYYGWEIKSLE